MCALKCKEDAMTKRMIFALLLVAAAAGPAAAQEAGQRGGIATETMSRLAGENSGNDILWNAIGLLGLFGLLGFERKHNEDSYHPSPLE
jgi:hypothetical protein